MLDQISCSVVILCRVLSENQSYYSDNSLQAKKKIVNDLSWSNQTYFNQTLLCNREVLPCSHLIYSFMPRLKTKNG